MFQSSSDVACLKIVTTFHWNGQERTCRNHEKYYNANYLRVELLFENFFVIYRVKWILLQCSAGSCSGLQWVVLTPALSETGEPYFVCTSQSFLQGLFLVIFRPRNRLSNPRALLFNVLLSFYLNHSIDWSLLPPNIILSTFHEQFVIELCSCFWAQKPWSLELSPSW